MALTTALDGVDSLPHEFEGHSRLLWWLGIAFYGVGDTVTTVGGVWTGQGVEAGPVVGAMMGQFGLAGLLAVKVVVLLGFFLAWRFVRSPGRVGLPLALAVVGVFVTGWNSVVLVWDHAEPVAAALL